MNKNIIILGSDGMVGRTVFLYLSSLFPQHVWGTTRNKKGRANNMFFLTAENYQKDFSVILRKVKKLDYVINCIGILKNTHPREELIHVNAIFPHLLEKLAEENNFRLIHISTDAVFPPLSRKVDESSPVGPIDYYGSSKLLGETTSKQALTFRSSFIGLDPNNHRGLLQEVLKTKKVFYGYTNQNWTGCTSLQFAKLCEDIIVKNLFLDLRKKSSIYHFAPLGPISKYQLIKTFSGVTNQPVFIKKKKADKITRELTTEFFDTLRMNEYTSNTKEAFTELVQFETKIKIK